MSKFLKIPGINFKFSKHCVELQLDKTSADLTVCNYYNFDSNFVVNCN